MEIRLESGSRRFGKTRALREVSATFSGGEIVAVLGLNGAGKTTFLNVLSGLLRLDCGQLTYGGQPFRRDRTEERRRVFIMPDAPLLSPESGLRNLAAILRIYGQDKAGIEDAAADVLSELDLWPEAAKGAGELSRGQAYKLILAGWILSGADILIVDEPFASGMDAEGIRVFRQHARKVAAAGGTVIYSTQLPDLAAGFADRVLLLHEGRLADDLSGANLPDGETLEAKLASLRKERNR